MFKMREKKVVNKIRGKKGRNNLKEKNCYGTVSVSDPDPYPDPH
jgi:hypothetical protein